MRHFYDGKDGLYFVVDNTIVSCESAEGALIMSMNIGIESKLFNIIKTSERTHTKFELNTLSMSIEMKYSRSGNWIVTQPGGCYPIWYNFMEEIKRLMSFKIINFTDEEFVDAFTTIFNALEELSNFMNSIKLTGSAKKA